MAEIKPRSGIATMVTASVDPKRIRVTAPSCHLVGTPKPDENRVIDTHACPLQYADYVEGMAVKHEIVSDILDNRAADNHIVFSQYHPGILPEPRGNREVMLRIYGDHLDRGSAAR